ncbi:hypothetical protein HOLleu_42010 [Holothuria leucospilota]|uniref:MADF domain-containing protein n=1 Tax=Holothuria leucospilota TaxID=206669 RepID=A0A9Q1BA00_HOLLE|nr:hypothetical protein HOLleu_42010 [Holothuria leucospilota]
MGDKKRDTDRKFMLEVIATYESLPALWKIKSDEYMKRDKKADAYNVLLQKYKEHFPAATLEELKKKLNILRTNFRSELRKVERSVKSGAGTEDLYVSSLWYFDALLFLRDQETTARSRSSIVVQEGNQEDNGDKEEPYQNDTTQDEDSVELDEVSTESVHTGSTQKSRQQQPSTSSADSGTGSTIPPTPRSAASKKRRVEAERSELMSLVKSRLLQESSEDEYDSQAKTWANELRRMDPRQQLYAKKAINDVLFEGRCGTLTRNSVQINFSQNLFHTVSAARSSTPYSTHSSASSPPQPSPVFRVNTQEMESNLVETNPLDNYFENFEPPTH